MPSISEPLVILGAGGHGRETLDVVRAINAVHDVPRWNFLGFVDMGVPNHEILERLGERHLGGADALGSIGPARFIVGIGSPRARKDMDSLATKSGLAPATLIHPSATIGADTEVGPGCVMFAHSSVTTNVRLGSHVHVNRTATIGHDAVVGDYVTLHPGAVVSGNAVLEDCVTLGTNAVVIPAMRVGRNTTVGAGGVVIDDLPPGVTAVGVPARAIHQ